MKRKHPKGKVILVGGGPGDPGLITLRGKEILEEADTVVYDWLVNPDLLRFAPKAEKIFVGKKGGTRYKKQEEIHRILLRCARQGKRVVRLKGGDPFIFGRGGEEASFLAEHRIPFEVVPGVSAGIGVPVYAGIPLTHRRLVSQVTFVTGHEDPRKFESEVDWGKLASLPGTLVSFMGVKNLPRIIKSLLKGGKLPRTPVAVVEWGTLPRQRVIMGALKNILKKTRQAKLDSPALMIIGEVTRLRKKLAWFEKRPLWGKTVLVTRARAQASELVRRLSEKGAQVVEYPTVQIDPPSDWRPLEKAIRGLSRFDWVVFTSTNGVYFFFECMKRLKRDARIFANVKVAAIGEATAQALREKGIQPDLVPREFTSAELFKSLKERGLLQGKKFLLARANIAPPSLKNTLQKEGAEVFEIETYRTVPISRKNKELLDWLRKGKINYITFTSSSTVRNFFKQVPSALQKNLKTQLVSIGPVTSEALREYGLEPEREAKVHTIEGLIAVLMNGGRKR